MIKKIILLSMFSMTLASTLSAQLLPPDTLWSKSYGGFSSSMNPWGLDLTDDGGAFISGFTFIDVFNSIYAVRTDNQGDTLWTTTIMGDTVGGISTRRYAYGGIQTSTGDYVLAGFLQNDAGTFGYLVKLNADGDTLWTKTYEKDDYFVDIVESSDGGFVTTGITLNPDDGSNDVLLMKTNSNGEVGGGVGFKNRFGGEAYDIGWEVHETNDGGFIIGGYTSSMGAGSNDVYLVKTFSNGTMEWEKTFGGTSTDQAWAVKQTSDGGYIIGGQTYSTGAGGSDFYLIKTLSNGDLDWEKTFGTPQTEVARSVQQTAEGHYVLAGYGNASGNNDVYIVKADAEGDLLWQKLIGDSEDQQGYNIMQTKDRGFMVSASRYYPGESLRYYWLIRLEGYYEDSYDLSNIFSFPERESPNDYTPNDYRLIGLPGDGNIPLNQVFTGEVEKDWLAYWDNGNPSTEPKDYLDKYDGSSNFNLRLGKAFWSINKGSVEVADIQVDTAPLDGQNMVTIPLENQGWVLITNPFTVPVPWPAVQAANGGISQPIFGYNGSQSTIMQPYTGYYFDNSGGLPNLKIPYPVIGKVSTAKSSEQKSDWKVNIHISKDAYVDSSSAFGVSKLAKPKHDDLDFRKPRIMGTWPSVFFDRSEWDQGYPIYATDIRPSGAAGYRWDFNVITGASKEKKEQQAVQLSFQDIESVPEELDVYLIDNVRFTQTDLRAKSAYSFIPDAKVEQFQVVVGNPEAVQQEIDNSLPTEFALKNNYPNPFNPSNPMQRVTTIPVLIPEQTEIQVDIYNLKGQIIKPLFEGNVDPGRIDLEWDGTDYSNRRVASGVYICRMQSLSGVRHSHKILVMK